MAAREASATVDGWVATVAELEDGSRRLATVTAPDGTTWITGGARWECSPAGAAEAALSYMLSHEGQEP